MSRLVGSVVGPEIYALK